MFYVMSLCANNWVLLAFVGRGRLHLGHVSLRLVCSVTRTLGIHDDISWIICLFLHFSMLFFLSSFSPLTPIDADACSEVMVEDDLWSLMAGTDDFTWMRRIDETETDPEAAPT